MDSARTPDAARRSACSAEQARVLLKYAERGEVAAFSVGLGSDGHPPGEEAWMLLTSNRSVWVELDGTERAS